MTTTDTRSHTTRGADALAAAGIPDATHPLDLDPVDVFGKLVREVDAGAALVTMSLDAGDKRRAALDALALARCVLDDARELLDEDTPPQLLSVQLGLPRRFRGVHS